MKEVRRGSVLRDKRKWMKTKSNVSSRVCFLLLITIIIYYNVGNFFVIFCRLICESFAVFTEFQPSVPPTNILPPWTSIQTLCYLWTLTISRIKGFFFFGSMWIPPLCFIRSPTGSGMFTAHSDNPDIKAAGSYISDSGFLSVVWLFLERWAQMSFHLS